jgi:hypothetical protein
MRILEEHPPTSLGIRVQVLLLCISSLCRAAQYDNYKNTTRALVSALILLASRRPSQKRREMFGWFASEQSGQTIRTI